MVVRWLRIRKELVSDVHGGVVGLRCKMNLMLAGRFQERDIQVGQRMMFCSDVVRKFFV